MHVIILRMYVYVDGQWDFNNYHIVTLGESSVSVRCLTVVANQRIWCAHRNRVHVVDSETLKIEVCCIIDVLFICH